MDTPRKIVVAVDDSQASENAFNWALHNLIRKTDHVILLNSAPYVGGLEFPNPNIANEYIVAPVTSVASAESAEKVVTEQSKDLVTKYMEHCKEAGISCEGEVLKGEPGSWIVDETNRICADVVVVGSHDSGVLKRTLLGSISDYVLHNANRPVVIVRQSETCHDTGLSKPSGAPRKIVIAVDGSNEAVHAFTWALQNFCTDSDKVIIYHVHHSTADTALGTGAFGLEEVYIPPDNIDKIEVQALNDSEKLVEKFMAYVSRETKISCEGMVVTGQTEAKVGEGLAKLKADAVVVGTHNRGALVRTFLGSVSDYLAHQSPCPLLVVKTKPSDVNFDDKAAHTHLP